MGGGEGTEGLVGGSQGRAGTGLFWKVGEAPGALWKRHSDRVATVGAEVMEDSGRQGLLEVSSQEDFPASGVFLPLIPVCFQHFHGSEEYVCGEGVSVWRGSALSLLY